MTFFVNSLLRFPPVEEIMEPLQDVKITVKSVNTGTTKIMILLIPGAGRISQPSAELFRSCPRKKKHLLHFFAIFTNFLGPANKILKGMSDVHLS